MWFNLIICLSLTEKRQQNQDCNSLLSNTWACVSRCETELCSTWLYFLAEIRDIEPVSFFGFLFCPHLLTIKMYPSRKIKRGPAFWQRSEFRISMFNRVSRANTMGKIAAASPDNVWIEKTHAGTQTWFEWYFWVEAKWSWNGLLKHRT